MGADGGVAVGGAVGACLVRRGLRGLLGPLLEAGGIAGGFGDAGLLRVVAGHGSLPAGGHRLDPAAADRDDDHADDRSEGGVEDAVDDVLRDVQLVERGDDAERDDQYGGGVGQLQAALRPSPY